VFNRLIQHASRARGPGLLIVVAFLATACASAPVAPTEPPTARPTVAATEALPPTATQAPTKAPTQVPTAAPELGPEEPATSIEQVAGLWGMRLAGGGGGDPAVLTLGEDGMYSMDGVGGDHDGMNLGNGPYRFEGDVFMMDSNSCLKPGPTDVFFECTGSYKLLVAMADGKPGKLHFVAIDDPFLDRKNSLDGKTMGPYVKP
jgi:hypothetical protein